MADQKFDNSSIFNFWSAVLNFKILLLDLDLDWRIPKTSIIKLSSESKDYFFVIVRQNEYNFWIQVTIKLFYLIQIELTIAIFPFFVISPKILAKWPPFWITILNFVFSRLNMALGHSQLPTKDRRICNYQFSIPKHRISNFFAMNLLAINYQLHMEFVISFEYISNTSFEFVIYFELFLNFIWNL